MDPSWGIKPKMVNATEKKQQFLNASSERILPARFENNSSDKLGPPGKRDTDYCLGASCPLIEGL
eukprot:6217565-Amphidinium_carterae.1